MTLFALDGPLAAQHREVAIFPAQREVHETSTSLLPTSSDSPNPSIVTSHWSGNRAFIASALIPGSGQWLLRQSRWPLYLAVEGLAWYAFVHQRREGTTFRRQYRDLAWTVAREPVAGDIRVDGDFRYYEALSKFVASGAFDRSPETPGIDPEVDPATYNGHIWLLARELYLAPAGGGPPDETSEEYERAIAFYRTRGIQPEFLWDWRGEEEKQARFGRLIRESDDALRRSTTMLGVVIGNHVLSSIDALISARMHSIAGPDARLELRLVSLHHDLGRALTGAGAYRGERIVPNDPWALRARLRF